MSALLSFRHDLSYCCILGVLPAGDLSLCVYVCNHAERHNHARQLTCHVSWLLLGCVVTMHTHVKAHFAHICESWFETSLPHMCHGVIIHFSFPMHLVSFHLTKWLVSYPISSVLWVLRLTPFWACLTSPREALTQQFGVNEPWICVIPDSSFPEH